VLFFSCCGSVATLPALANCKERPGAAGNGPGTPVKYLQQTTSGAAGNGLANTANYLRRTTGGAADIGLGTTIKYLRCAAGIGLGTAAKYLRRSTSGAAGKNKTSSVMTKSSGLGWEEAITRRTAS
jgi:hypothetical protein